MTDLGGVVPGNIYAMTPQQQAAWILSQQARQRIPANELAKAWPSVLTGPIEGLAENLQNQRILGMLGQQARDVPSTLPSLTGAGGTTDAGDTGAPPQPSTASDHGLSVSDQTTPEAYTALHEISPSDLKTLTNGGKVYPYQDGAQTSIGFGTKAQPGDENGLTGEQARDRFRQEYGQAQQFVDQVAPNASPQWKVGLADLTYRTGQAWANSGLGTAVRSGNWQQAEEIYPQYNKVRGADGRLVESKGLDRRNQDFLKVIRGDQALAFAPQTSTPPGMPQTAPAAPPGSPMSRINQGFAAAGAPAPAGQAAPVAGGPPPAVAPTAAGGAPAGLPPQLNEQGKRFIPPDQTAIAAFNRDRAQAANLMRFPPGTPERQRGEALATDLQKRLEPTPYVDQRTGITYLGTDLQGRTESNLPRQPTKPEEAGLTKTQEGRAAYYNSMYTGTSGMGTIAADQKPYIDAMRQIIQSPDYLPGSWGQGTLLAFRKFAAAHPEAAATLGVDTASAAPNEMVRMLQSKMMGNAYSTMKSESAEAGETAAKIFQTEAENMNRAAITDQDSKAGALAKLDLMDHITDNQMGQAKFARSYRKQHGQLDEDFENDLQDMKAKARVAAVDHEARAERSNQRYSSVANALQATPAATPAPAPSGPAVPPEVAPLHAIATQAAAAAQTPPGTTPQRAAARQVLQEGLNPQAREQRMQDWNAGLGEAYKGLVGTVVGPKAASQINPANMQALEQRDPAYAHMMGIAGPAAVGAAVGGPAALRAAGAVARSPIGSGMVRLGKRAAEGAGFGTGLYPIEEVLRWLQGK